MGEVRRCCGNPKNYSRVVLFVAGTAKRLFPAKRSSTKVQSQNESKGPVRTGQKISSLSIGADCPQALPAVTEVNMFFAAIFLFCFCTPVDQNSGSSVDTSVLVAGSVAEKSFVPAEKPSAPEPKEADATPPADPIIPRTAPLPSPAGKGLFLSSYEVSPHKKAWFALSVAGHSGAAFDAWSTRRAISRGYSESNPLLKPFANSNAIYAATQLTPLVMDYVGRRMMFNKRSWVRRAWWVPQAASAAFSFGAGIHNVGVVH
jgi:hypothetical protein